jgi:hypothetical protein
MSRFVHSYEIVGVGEQKKQVLYSHKTSQDQRLTSITEYLVANEITVTPTGKAITTAKGLVGEIQSLGTNVRAPSCRSKFKSFYSSFPFILGPHLSLTI